MVIMVSDVDINQLSVKKSKDAQYLQLGTEKINIQTPWITLPKFPLTGRSFVKEADNCIGLTIPIAEGDELHKFFSEVDNFLEAKELMPKKTLHKLVSNKDGLLSVKFKLYLNTIVFVGKEEKKVSNIYDYYNNLTEGRDVRIIFNFTKLWALNGAYGFAVRVEKLQLKEEQSILDTINNVDFSD